MHKIFNYYRIKRAAGDFTLVPEAVLSTAKTMSSSYPGFDTYSKSGAEKHYDRPHEDFSRRDSGRYFEYINVLLIAV